MKIAVTHSYLLLYLICLQFVDAAYLPLVFAPESGNMLGGTVVNITGPCFDKNERVLCTFDSTTVVGHVIEGDRNRAICVQPMLMAQGYVRFQISIGNDRFKWRGLYFVGMLSYQSTFYLQFHLFVVFILRPVGTMLIYGNSMITYRNTSYGY